MIEVCLDTQHSQTNTWQYLSNAKDMKYAQHDTIQCLALTLIVATFKECLTSTAFESCRPSWTNYFRIVNTHTLPLLISHKGRYSATQQGNDHRRLRGLKHHDNCYVVWRVLSKVSQPVSYLKHSILPMLQNILFVWNTLATTVSIRNSDVSYAECNQFVGELRVSLNVIKWSSRQCTPALS